MGAQFTRKSPAGAGPVGGLAGYSRLITTLAIAIVEACTIRPRCSHYTHRSTSTHLFLVSSPFNHWGVATVVSKRPPAAGQLIGAISKFWRGDVALVISFWIFGIIFLRVVAAPFYLVLAEHDLVANLDFDGRAAAILLYRATIIAFTMFIYFGIWRSANNYKGSHWWARLAQASVIVGVVFEVVAVARMVENWS